MQSTEDLNMKNWHQVVNTVPQKRYTTTDQELNNIIQINIDQLTYHEKFNQVSEFM